MTTKIEVCNMALSHIGVGKEITDFDNDSTPEAKALRTFYDTALDKVLRDFSWPFANKTVSLSLVGEDPDTYWRYSYRYPSDAVKLVKIQSGLRNDSRQTRIAYRLTRDVTGMLLYVDSEDAILEYTARITDVSKWPADFIMAFSYYLAFLVSARLSAGDPFKMKNEMAQLYMMEIQNAKVNSLNESQDEEWPESELIRARD